MFENHSILFELFTFNQVVNIIFTIMKLRWTFHANGQIYLVLLLVIAAAKPLFAQSNDSTRSTRYFGGSASITNNGLSLVPTFSLNKPAALVILNMGKRFTFDPEFRFSLEGKPWSFIFWGRYKLIQQGKFRLTVGLHPGYLFNTQTTVVNGNTSNIITTERYLASEISPSYYITKNTSIGIYYLRSKGFSESAVKNLHFITLNANFNRIGLIKSYYLKFNPQIYYLKMDDSDGYYLTATVTLAKTHFPVSLQSTMNRTIESQIPSKDFIWNVSLIYSFGKQYKPV